MKNIITVIPVLALSLILLSCSKLSSSLDTIEKTIGSDPEKAVELLDDLRPEVRSKHDRARYALLKSLAMDALWIDYESDSLTSFALDYYKDHGSADEKLKAYFLHAMYYDNIGERETEMEYLVQAEKFIPDADDPVISGRLYGTASSIFYEILDDSLGLDYAKKSYEQYLAANDSSRIANSLIGISDFYKRMGNTDRMLSYLDLAGTYISASNRYVVSSFYEEKLIHAITVGKNVSSALNDYLSNCPENEVQWNHVANAYIAMGECSKAMDALEIYSEADKSVFDSAAYYSLKALAYQGLGQYRDAYFSHVKYSKKYDDFSKARYEQDTKFLKERYDRQLIIENAKSRVVIISLITVLVVLCLAVIVVVFVRKVKRDKAERIELEESNNEVKVILRRELTKLHNILSRYVNKGEIDKKVDKAIQDALGNHETFQKSLRMMYGILYPDFIAFLEEHGLDECEIEMSCLYCMGMSGKGIYGYTNNCDTYHDSSDIRRKFGLPEKGTNISLYLREKFRDFYPEDAAK